MKKNKPIKLLLLICIILVSIFPSACSPQASLLKKKITPQATKFSGAARDDKSNQHVYYRDAAIVLIYHDVDIQECGTAISPQRFARHMTMLDQNGFSVVSLADVTAFVEHGATLPPNAVAITLDDACASNYEVVLPALQARHWPMAIFATVSQIGQTRPNGLRRLNWLELKKMSQAGVLVGSHTYDGHKTWTNQQGRKAYWLTECMANESRQQYRARVLNDLIHSREKLEQTLGQPVVHFAHPFGAYNATTVKLAQQAGYRYIWTTHPVPVRRNSSLSSLGRVSVGIKGTSAEQLKATILKAANN